MKYRCVSYFLISVPKYLDKGNLKEEGLMLSYSSKEIQSVVMEKAQPLTGKACTRNRKLTGHIGTQ